MITKGILQENFIATAQYRLTVVHYHYTLALCSAGQAVSLMVNRSGFANKQGIVLRHVTNGLCGYHFGMEARFASRFNKLGYGFFVTGWR